MKIGIITCWTSSDNYGQKLQCFALQDVLRKMGHDPFLIRYNPNTGSKSFFNKAINCFKSPSVLLKYIPFTRVYKDKKIETYLHGVNSERNKERQFDSFVSKYISVSKKIYASYDELKRNPPVADVYITGADQVWHTSFHNESIKGWCLQFGQKDTIRISYAASVGREISKSEIPLFKKYLSRLNAISVREEPTMVVCKQIGIKAQLCIDPTLLLSLSDYSKMISTIEPQDKYIFLYIINIKESKDFYWHEISSYIKSNNLSFKCVTSSGYYQARNLIDGYDNLMASIPEWLYYIKYSESVFTSSYHGVLFCILMHRPFLFIELQGEKKSANIRVEQLLNILNLEERVLNPNIEIKLQMENNINWSFVDEQISILKQSSMLFLKNNLSYKRIYENKIDPQNNSSYMV